MKLCKKFISLILAVLMATSALTVVDFSAYAETDNISEYTIYKYEYFSDIEAKAFIGFLLGTNDLNEQLWDTDIFKFLTGKLSDDIERENEARIAFLSISTEMLNARIKDNEQKTNIASTNLIVFLQNRYGIDLDAELVNPLINKEFGSIKEMIKGFISIATDTDLIEIDAVDSIFSSVELIVNRDKKIEEYTKCIQAIFDLTNFTTSAQQLDMYRQFMLYISNAKCYLDFGDTNISQTIVGLTQSTYDLNNERSKWADCISNIVQRVDVFGLLNDYWLNWNTDDRIKLLKKWASFIALSQSASEECVEPVLTSYSKTRQSITKSDGTTISYRTRKYNLEIDLTYEIDKADLNYTIKNNKVIITDYVGYAGKYKNVPIPTRIDGKKVTEIAEHAFEECNFSTIIIPRNIEKIGDYSFYGNTGIQKLLILNDKVKIGEHAFDWQMGSADQSIGNVPVYCEYNSNAYEFCSKKEGFFYKSLDWNGTSVWGVASSNNTYHINCGPQLAYISKLIDKVDLEGFTISVDSNIYLGNKDFTSIGNTDHPYKGSFNGNGNKIFGLKYKPDNDYDDNNGLFSYVIGKGNKFSDIELYGQQTMGAGIVGDLIGTLYVEENSNVTISNITTNIVASNTRVANRGGIVGKIIGNSRSDIKLENCKNLAYKFALEGYVGGIVGYSNLKDNSSLRFYKCLNNATVTSSVIFAYNASFSGGILGKGEGGNYIFQECAVDGSIYSEGNGSLAISGGLVAALTPTSVKIENCELFAYVYGYQYFSSGIIGNLLTKNINYNESYIKNTYVSDYIPDKYAAGFIGCDNKDTYNLSIINSYFNNDVSKANYLVVQLSAGGFFYGTDGVEEKEWCVNSSFKTGDELKKNHSLYDEWDFVNVWKYDEGGYPILKCFENITPCSEHNFINKIISPTCTAKGYTKHTCSKCGYTYNDAYVDALGHDFSMYVKTVAPTCTDQGYDAYNCSKGDAWTKRNLVPALGHTYSEKPTAHLDPTCNRKGYDEYTCSRCNGTKRDEIAALDGSALTSALDNAKKRMESGVFTDESVSVCQKVCDKYENAVNELHSQADVDNATAEVTSAYENLVLKDTVTGTLDNGITWTFTKDGAKLSFAGEGEVPKFESGSAPWKYCGNIETLEFGEGITSIAGYAFTGYGTVKKIKFPSTLTTINIRAFEYCYAVEELVIPDSVTFIGYGTFASLTSLKKVTVPASVGYASYAFEHDEQIEKIIITPSIDGIMPECIRTNNLGFPFGSNLKYTGAFGPWRNANNATVDIQYGVKSIGKNTFYGAKISRLTVMGSVKEIGYQALKTSSNTDVYVYNRDCVIDETNTNLSNVNIMIKNINNEFVKKEHTHIWSWHYNNDAVYNSSSDYKDGTQTRTCSACG
ncbi:MAG: leucine-rich repeat protein, partial [Erysipelotrichia bacterium]|nr:leucine-rich repeat protein [Erysipelotrichia bacterium]